MPGIATGEVFAWPEGKLYLYASASGTTSGSGIGFAEDATLSIAYGWRENTQPDGTVTNHITGKRVELAIGKLHASTTLFNIANATGAVNAKFETLVTGGLSQSAQFLLYSGWIDSFTVAGQAGGLFHATLTMHANIFSGFGQG